MEEADTHKSERHDDEVEGKNDVKESKAEENPLEKYMKMVLEAREKQQVQQSPEQEAKPLSFEDKTVTEDKDDRYKLHIQLLCVWKTFFSIAAYSHKDDDEDFW